MTTKEQEERIEILNKWLDDNSHLEGSQFYRLKKHDRDYYVDQLVKKSVDA